MRRGQQILLGLKTPRISPTGHQRPRRCIHYRNSAPSITSASFWKSLIPKPLRSDKKADPNTPKKASSKEWNPATFYIVMFMLIGSMPINMLSLKNHSETFIRQSDVRIGLLREIVERIQRGEKVDVEKALGSGDPAQEAEWEEVIREIERDERSRNTKKQEKARQTSKLEQASQPSDSSPASPDATRPESTGLANFF